MKAIELIAATKVGAAVITTLILPLAAGRLPIVHSTGILAGRAKKFKVLSIHADIDRYDTYWFIWTYTANGIA